MTNKEKLINIVNEYSEDINKRYFNDFSKKVLRNCGSIVLRKIEDTLCPMDSYYRDLYTIIDDVVFNLDVTELVRYSPEKLDSSYTVPNSVKTIADGAFQECQHLQKVTLHKNITRVGNRAFSECPRLSEITWHIAQATGGSYVFENCPKLKTIVTDDAQKLWQYCCDNFGSPFINKACLIVDGKECDTISVPNNSHGSLLSFQGCTSIKNITFTENNKHVENLLLMLIDH